MKTIICYPSKLADTDEINISSWIISNYLEKQGYEVFYNEVEENEEIDLTVYFDQLALYCLEDCLTPETFKRIIMSRHILHCYCTTTDIRSEVGLSPVVSNHRFSYSFKHNAYLPRLIWQEFHKTEFPDQITTFPEWQIILNTEC